MNVVSTTVGILVFLAAQAFGQVTILWDESVNGPLSQYFANPTALPQFQLGTNSVIGSTELERMGNNWVGHDDFFTIQVPGGATVSSVMVQVDRPNAGIWLGDQGYASQQAFAANPSIGPLLPQWGIQSIGSGIYGIYVADNDQQSVTTLLNYRLDFFVQAIPEPGVVSFFMICAGVVGFVRWKKVPLIRGS